MTTRYLDGPVDYRDTPNVVYAGESFKLEVPVYDGVVTGSDDHTEYGDLLTVAASTIKGVLTINKPDGTTDVIKDTSVGGEGAKYDHNSDGTNDGFRFYVAHTTTADWTAGTHNWEVEYQDSSASPADRVLVAIGRIEVKVKPSAE